MKLRNKKTGEVKELRAIFLVKTVRETGRTTSDHVERFYYRIADLNEEWEDYEPKEPLIKDEKIRKAVRAWAGINANKIETFALGEYRRHKDDDGFWNYTIHGYVNSRNYNVTSIRFQFRTINEIKFDHNISREYTLEELCGEEEE